MHPAILHADVDAFYASVAQRDDPSLRGRPVVVGSWVVMAASYEARAYGVRGAMPTSKARRLCPQLVVAQPEFGAFTEASRQVFEIFRRHTDVVEAGSMEEAFLDVTAHPADPRALAQQLRHEVRDEVGLPLSVGVARTKVLAKIASREAKPDGLFVVEPEDEIPYLHALPVERLHGVGPATTARLHAHGLRTVSDVAALEEDELKLLLGKASGRYLHAIAHGREVRRVRRARGRRSFGAQRALGRGPRTEAELEEAIDRLASRLEERMAKKARAGRTIVLRLRFADYERATRSATLTTPTGDAQQIATEAKRLLRRSRDLIARRGITLVGLTVTNLDGEAGARQLSLLDPSDDWLCR